MKKILLVFLVGIAWLSPIKAGLLEDSLVAQSVVPFGLFTGAGGTFLKIAGACGLGLVYGRACLNSYLKKSERDAQPKNKKAAKISTEELEKRKKSHFFYSTLLKVAQVCLPIGFAVYGYAQSQNSRVSEADQKIYKVDSQISGYVSPIELMIQLLF